jgi:phospholipid transport system substrate-binding protein
MKTTYRLAFLLLAWIATAAFAESSPLPMLQSTSNQMIAALKQNQSSLKSDPKIVYGIVHRILLPHVDVAAMSHAVLGPAWNSATPAQQREFGQQFTTLLIHTYSSAFASYKDEVVKFYPIRGDITGRNSIQANSQVIRKNGPPIDVSYRLVQRNGQWKVADFSVDGISIIQSFRSQFSQELNQGGIAGLIRRLSEHNARQAA